MTDDERDIAAEAAYMAKYPRMFTKREMTVKLAAAAKMVEDLRMLVGTRRHDAWHR